MTRSRPIDPEKERKYEALLAEQQDMLQNPRKYIGEVKGKAAAGAQRQASAGDRAGSARAGSVIRCRPTWRWQCATARHPSDCEVHIHGDVQDLGPKVPRGLVQVVSRPGE